MNELPEHWSAYTLAGGETRLVRSDRQSLLGSADPSNWSRQIADFEFAEGAQWTAEQAATIARREALMVKEPWIDTMAPAQADQPFVANRIWGFDRVQEALDSMNVQTEVIKLEPKPSFYVREDLIDWREPVPDSRGAVTTNAMLTAGFQAGIAAQPGSPLLTETLEAIYRAMHAVAPVELVSEGERQAVRERDAWKRQCEKWKRDFLSARDVLNCNEREIFTLRADLAKALAQATEAPAPDYVGPTAPDQDGRPVPVTDVVHERFHQSIKDVLAGNVIQGARRQMQEALKTVPKEVPTTASTSASMPKGALFGGGDPRRMGPEGI